jgi:hypothetical protein
MKQKQGLPFTAFTHLSHNERLSIKQPTHGEFLWFYIQALARNILIKEKGWKRCKRKSRNKEENKTTIIPESCFNLKKMEKNRTY